MNWMCTFLLASCLTPMAKAVGRPLLLIELYFAGYVVYRVLVLWWWVFVFGVYKCNVQQLLPTFLACDF